MQSSGVFLYSLLLLILVIGQSSSAPVDETTAAAVETAIALDGFVVGGAKCHRVCYYNPRLERCMVHARRYMIAHGRRPTSRRCPHSAEWNEKSDVKTKILQCKGFIKKHMWLIDLICLWLNPPNFIKITFAWFTLEDTGLRMAEDLLAGAVLTRINQESCSIKWNKKENLKTQKFPQGALQRIWLIDFACIWSNLHNYIKLTLANPVSNKEKIPIEFAVHHDFFLFSALLIKCFSIFQQWRIMFCSWSDINIMTGACLPKSHNFKRKEKYFSKEPRESSS